MTYLDNAATTPLAPEVLEKMLPYLTNVYGNASSVHTPGREARLGVERSRSTVAKFLGAQDSEIIFTSSASEANNLAIKGVVEFIRKEMARGVNEECTPEIVASPIEHPCVMEALRHLESLGWVKVVWLPVDQSGMVSAESVGNALTEKTVLVSVMYVNNEVGTVMPIQDISYAIQHHKKQRVGVEKALPLYFHTDAVQAIQYYDHSVQSLGVDLMSLTGHKLSGPKGVGVLYVRDGIQFVRQLDGGGQEYYKRAGTENVAGIVGLGAAIERLQENTVPTETLLSYQRTMIDNVLNTIPISHLTGHAEKRAPHITSFLFEDIDPEMLLVALDRHEIAVSSGSACSAGIVKQSHVISALGFDATMLKNSAALRISTSAQTKPEDIEKLITVLPQVVDELRTLWKR